MHVSLSPLAQEQADANLRRRQPKNYGCNRGDEDKSLVHVWRIGS